MKTILLLFTVAILIISCASHSTDTVSIPAKPVSIETVSQFLKGKTYETKKVATLSPFQMDEKNPYEWMNDAKDTTKFFRDYLKERMSLSIEFINDTSVILNEESKKITGTYKFDTATNENEKKGIKLRISYPDASMDFPGATGPMIMTSTFIVSGADEKNLLLQTPRSFNNQEIAVLLQAK